MPRLLNPDLPRFVSFGEALTDLVRTGPNEWRSVCAGAPWNVAMAMSALGERCGFAGSISQDVFGQAIWQASVAASLDLRFIQLCTKPPLLSVVDQLDPQASFCVGNGSADLFFRPEGLPVGWVRPLRWAHFGSLSLVRQPLATRLLILAESLKAEGKRISYAPNFHPVMDARYDEALERMCVLADLIKVSENDLRRLFRNPDHRVGLARISAWNPDASLLLTQGAEGATLYRGAQAWHARPPSVDVLDTRGAGDAALAGLLFSMMQDPDAPPPQHLRWSVAAAAATCTVEGMSLPPLNLVLATADRVTVQLIR